MGEAAARKTVLVVDDQTDHREIATALLHHAGYRTMQAENVAAAERLLRIQRPDLILLDISMPHKNGLEWVFELRSSAATARLPILAYTSFRDVYTDELHRLRVPVLDKSERPERFIERIEAALAEAPIPDNQAPGA